MERSIPSISLRWVFYHAAVEGAPHGLFVTFKPPPRDAQPNLIYFTYGIAEVDSSLAGRPGVKGDKSPPSESAWLSNWFCLHLETPNVIAFCPTALALMRLKFQSVVHQTSECWESPEWLHREPPITMVT